MNNVTRNAFVWTEGSTECGIDPTLHNPGNRAGEAKVFGFSVDYLPAGVELNAADAHVRAGKIDADRGVARDLIATIVGKARR